MIFRDNKEFNRVLGLLEHNKPLIGLLGTARREYNELVSRAEMVEEKLRIAVRSWSSQRQQYEELLRRLDELNRLRRTLETENVDLISRVSRAVEWLEVKAQRKALRRRDRIANALVVLKGSE